MKALMTGAAGFISSHLLDVLLKRGYSVTGIDNLSVGRMSNLAGHVLDDNFVFERCDIRDQRKLTKLFRYEFDVVFHLAASADIRKSLKDHHADLDNNVVGTVNLLDCCVKSGVKDFVFASSSAVYGEAKVVPTPETYMPTQTSLYGASKLACESFLQGFTEMSDLHCWAYRFANVVGERCRRGVVGDFVRKLQTNPKVLEILGDGKQSKEYLYVQDCIEGMLTGYRKSNGRFNVFNLGVPKQTCVDEVADIVIREMRLKNVKRKYTGGRRGWVGDNPVVNLSLEKIKRLGWKPKVSSEEAIKRTARWNMKNE